tara:strand:+ start:1085 stop:2308 length:1224 start_codon:yes stop_codon:yes gene_type:complete
MKFFSNQYNKTETTHSARNDFEYVSADTVYLDSACQTLRPQPVLDAMNEYFQEYNACGGRVKYEWGKQVDEKVEEARMKVLNFLGKKNKEYQTSFTLNTTYGLNLLLQQLPVGKYKQIITSEIEHNSVFLPVIVTAERLNIIKKILPRNESGSLVYEKEDLTGAIVVVNATSNIDGRVLQNAKQLADDVHNAGGILIIDGAQSMVGSASLLRDVDFDALCFSAHKMHSTSLGVIVAKKVLINSLKLSFVGGGMVEKLDENGFSPPLDDLACKLEPGLQDFAGIIALGATIDWLRTYKPEGLGQEAQKQKLAKMLFDGVSSLRGVHLLNNKPSSTMAFYSDDIDAHRLATFFSEQNIMTRSGYFCCHYYLQNVKKYPPLLRVSLGLHNTEKDVRKFLEVLEKIIKNIQ